MIELKGIELSYDRPILKSINFKISKAEIVGVVGKSGAGKSTLLKIIAGICSADEGTVTIDSKILPKASTLLIPGFKDIAIVNQDFKLDIYHTVEENIREAVLSLPILERDKRVRNLLRLFELQKIAALKANLISGGEQQRLAIARAVAKRPRLLVLDEPFGHLDSVLRQKLSHYLLQIRTLEETAILIVSHDGQDVLGLCDSVCFLQNGKLTKKKKVEQVYYDCSNINLARLLGPVNSITLNGDKINFRPDEYEITKDGLIDLFFQNAVFAGGFYLNYFKNSNNETIILYGLTKLNEIKSIGIKRAKY